MMRKPFTYFRVDKYGTKKETLIRNSYFNEAYVFKIKFGKVKLF